MPKPAKAEPAKAKADSELCCPMCGSSDLNFKPWLGIVYECRGCGWRGPLALRKRRGRRRQEST